QAGVMQGGTGAQGKVDGGQRAAIGAVVVAGGEQQRYRAAPGNAVETGAGKQFVALMVSAKYQQVGAGLLHLLQHALGRLALAQAQLAAWRRELAQAAVQGLLDALALGLAELRVEYVQQGESGVVLACQLAGTAQGEVGGAAQVVGNQNMAGHLIPRGASGAQR